MEGNLFESLFMYFFKILSKLTFWRDNKIVVITGVADIASGWGPEGHGFKSWHLQATFDPGLPKN